MPWYTYFVGLVLISAFVALLERWRPARPEQQALRPWLWSDLLHLIVNGHLLGVVLYGLARRFVLPTMDGWLTDHGWFELVYRNAASDWPWWVQVPVALVAIDFVQWCVHVMLHRVPLLWSFHKAHHSIVDGEMDWIVSFRFQWTEVVVYRAVLYLPLAWFGFGEAAVLFHALFGTLIGHLNHANVAFDYGPFARVLNSPKMHIWHHDYHREGHDTVNFGIIFSTWDFLFGTAHLPDHPPQKLGFGGVETFPRDFFRQTLYPLDGAFPAGAAGQTFAALAGVAAWVGAWWIVQEPAHTGPIWATEQTASSQPHVEADLPWAEHQAAATDALSGFGRHARAAGWAHPDAAVSAEELVRALGSDQLVVLDIRPAERFEEGHLPTAQPLEAKALGEKLDGVGLAASTDVLVEALRTRGVDRGDVVVLYGDGGPEPYRVWWTLRERTGIEARVLDGGLQGWAALGAPVPAGAAEAPPRGDVNASDTRGVTWTWDALQARLHGSEALLVDTRTPDEHKGTIQHPGATRAGRIPGSRNVPWNSILVGPDDPSLRPLDDLQRDLAPFLQGERPVVTWCQSGNRSSAVYYALLQAGLSPERLYNYDGSWAEYSRSDRPLETCATC